MDERKYGKIDQTARHGQTLPEIARHSQTQTDTPRVPDKLAVSTADADEFLPARPLRSLARCVVRQLLARIQSSPGPEAES